MRGAAWLSLRDRLLAGRSVGQFVRFLLTGAVNTAFGYGVYAGLTWALTGRIPGAYVVAAVLGNIIAITFSYLLYKLVVFRTRGNYLREYIRTFMVYGGVTVLGLLLLPVMVEIMGINPYLAPLLILPFTVLSSFFGHKHFSFRSPNTGRSDA